MSTQFDTLRKATTYIAGFATIATMLAIPALADTTSTTTTTTTTMPATGTMIDYSVLISPPISHFDMVRAHAFGLNTTQIGRVAAISAWTGAPPEEILNKLENGATFPTLCVDYGVSVDKLYGQTKYTQWVRDYREAYKHTGIYRMKHPEMNDMTTVETTTTTTTDND